MVLDPDGADAWLDSLAGIGWRPGLERIEALCEALGRPQDRFRSIHVVGTNGKTSTTRAALAILSARDIPSGCMTSPHFERWSERVMVGDRPADPSIWSRSVTRVRDAVAGVEADLTDSGPITQFEASVASEFLCLAESGVEVAVVEAGMGGRLDATNVLSSEVVVLTSVGLDHTEWLGPTTTDIATEKLAVLDPGATLVTGPLDPGVTELALRIAGDLSCEIVEVAQPELQDWPRGGFRRLAFELASVAVESLIGPSDRELLDRVARELQVPGRFELIPGDPDLIFDVAHNPDGIRALTEAVPEVSGGRPVIAVFGVLSDKDGEAMLEVLRSVADRVILCRPAGGPVDASGREATDPAELAGYASAMGIDALVVEDPSKAIALARAEASSAGGTGGVVLVCGSHRLRAGLQD